MRYLLLICLVLQGTGAFAQGYDYQAQQARFQQQIQQQIRDQQGIINGINQKRYDDGVKYRRQQEEIEERLEELEDDD